jgi:murein DD-endopeptidase MepM/ murein hydrolase activator NlpD
MTQTGRMSSSAHKGFDIRCGARRGAPTHAAAGGTGTWAGWRGGYGNSVIISADGGTVTTYNHFDRLGGVHVGQSAGSGDVVGYCGATGNVTGPHVHFEVKKNGYFVDPQQNNCGR